MDFQIDHFYWKNTMPKLVIVLCALLAISYPSMSQKQANNWLFGRNGWINFNSGTAVAQGGGMFSNLEGSASISDENGSLLFYTDGRYVWNKNHGIMANGTGLKGSASSTQSAVIVPYPGNSDLYYVFTIDDCLDSLANGFRYSIVDMSRSSGLGEVTTKNQLLRSMTTEKITGVMHVDNKSIWVITHGYKNNEFYSYLVTASGIQFQPVLSVSGSVHNGSLLGAKDVCGSLGSARGYMKTSPDGKKLAVAVTRSDFVEIFDFDNTTGRISNPTKIMMTEPYGLEFSPDGSLLYIGGWKDLTHKANLFQVDLSDNSVYSLTSGSDVEFGAVQVGPDQKLYVAIGYDADLNESPYIARINDPNKKGASCNLDLKAIKLATNTYSLYGLPTFIQTYFYKPAVIAENFCYGNETRFILKDSLGIASAVWDFGDPASGASSNDSKLLKPSHRFSDGGNYLVRSVFTYINGHIDTVQMNVRINRSKFILPHDTVVCPSVSVLLDAGPDFTTYLWSNSTTSQSVKTSIPDTYVLTAVDVYGCNFKDSITLKNTPILKFDLGSDTSYCGSFVLKAPSAQAEYVWNGVKSGAEFKMTNSGKVRLVLKDKYGCSFQDSIQLTRIPDPFFKLGNDTLICKGQSITFTASDGYDSYLWSNGSRNKEYTTNNKGIYSLTVSNKCGSYTSKISLDVQLPPTSLLSGDTAICDGGKASLNCKQVFSTYEWSDGSTLPSLTVSREGMYKLRAKNSCGWFSDSSYVKVNPRPVIPFPLDTSVCDGSVVSLDAGAGMLSYQWNSGNTDRWQKVQNSGHFFVKVTNALGCINAGSCDIVFYPRPQIQSIDTSVYAQAYIVAQNGSEPYSYVLDNRQAQADPLFTRLVPGTYSVKVIDARQCVSDPGKIVIGPLPIQIPNFFTPNNDGINDLWRIAGLEHFPDASVQVFDRYGRLLYQFKSGEQGWNGTFGSHPVPSDDYWYKLDLRYMEIVLNGHFTLKR